VISMTIIDLPFEKEHFGHHGQKNEIKEQEKETNKEAESAKCRN